MFAILEPAFLSQVFWCLDFVSVLRKTEKLQGNICSVNTDFNKYLSDRVATNFVMHSADTEEILRIILSLNNSKSSGPNSIPTEILKLLGPNICVPLKEIINISFATGQYPEKLKIAEIVAVFKNKGDPRQVNENSENFENSENSEMFSEFSEFSEVSKFSF